MLTLVLMATTGIAASAMAATAPHVGCPADGQQGPQAAPAGQPRPMPAKGFEGDASGGAKIASLADYVMADGTRTLAPRGWRCAGRYGSDGSVLFVAPDAATLKALLTNRPVAGPAIVRRVAFGGTSGRFAVARVAAMLFPAASRFVADVEAEAIAGPFRRGLPRGDRITRLGAWAALYTTPANGTGFGTRSAFAPGPLPVDGLAILDPEEDHDMKTLDMRLPKPLRPLVAAIIADMRRSYLR